MSLPRFFEWLLHESSLHSLLEHGTRDIYIILLSRYLRMFAFGGAALVLGIYLWLSGNKGSQIGWFMSLSLLGDAAISYTLTITADRIGRRMVLRIGSFLMVFAGSVFFWTSNYVALLVAAIVGVITPGAHEVGPFRAVEESTLAQLTPLEARTDVYAWFAVTSTLGMAAGLLISGYITYFIKHHFDLDWKDPKPYPYIFAIYTAIGLIKVVLTFFLSDKCEQNYDRQTELDEEAALANDAATTPLMEGGRRSSYLKGAGARMKKIGGSVNTKLTPESKSILVRLCILFAVNSFASGMLPVTLMSWYANWRYRWFVTYRIGYAMALVWLVASVANLFSASVARRLGLVKAMVFTHLPNAIFLGLIPLAPTWRWMLAALLLSAAFGSMDQAPRSAFVAAVFLPSERTHVMGTLNLVKTLASAGGPLLTGYLHDKKLWGPVFVISAILKISYDIGLLSMFLKTKLPEQGRRRDLQHMTIADVDPGILMRDHHLAHPDEFGELDADDFEVDRASYDGGPGKANYQHIEEV